MYSLILSEALSRLVQGMAPALFLKKRFRFARLFALVTGTGSPFLKMNGGLYIYKRISGDREGQVKYRQERLQVAMKIEMRDGGWVREQVLTKRR